MKEYLFENNEINLIKFISKEKPIRIWWEHIRYVFEYRSFFIKIEVELAEKFLIDTVLISEFGSQNIEQYVMTSNIQKVDSNFEPSEIATLISENEKIIDVSIVRTVLYFTRPKQIQANKSYFQNDSHLINPLSESKIIADKKYLVDIGIVVHLQNDKMLNCFVIENDDDFATNDFHGHNNIEILKNGLYQLITVNAS